MDPVLAAVVCVISKPSRSHIFGIQVCTENKCFDLCLTIDMHSWCVKILETCLLRWAPICSFLVHFRVKFNYQSFHCIDKLVLARGSHLFAGYWNLRFSSLTTKFSGLLQREELKVSREFYVYTLNGPTEMGKIIARKRVLCSDPKIWSK